MTPYSFADFKGPVLIRLEDDEPAQGVVVAVQDGVVTGEGPRNLDPVPECGDTTESTCAPGLLHETTALMSTG